MNYKEVYDGITVGREGPAGEVRFISWCAQCDPMKKIDIFQGRLTENQAIHDLKGRVIAHLKRDHGMEIEEDSTSDQRT